MNRLKRKLWKVKLWLRVGPREYSRIEAHARIFARELYGVDDPGF
jgi:hypothetical protein